jgi:hypothetical protein
MKHPSPAALTLIAAILWAACAGSNGEGGTTPLPQPPVVPSPQPPDYDISGPWTGSDSDSAGSGALDLFLFQDGGVILGIGNITEDKQRALNLAGTLSASTLYFNFNYGGNCVRAVSGTMAVGPSTMTGTFSGSNSCGGAITGGQVSLTSGRLDLAGTWSGDAPSVLGGGTWTWQIQQTNNRITASVNIATNNLHETDALQGVFYYPSSNPTFSFDLVLSSPPCAGVHLALTPLRDTLPISATKISGLATLGVACLGPGSFGDFVLTKQ